jgi:hypothetical protein
MLKEMRIADAGDILGGMPVADSSICRNLPGPTPVPLPNGTTIQVNLQGTCSAVVGVINAVPAVVNYIDKNSTPPDPKVDWSLREKGITPGGSGLLVPPPPGTPY